MTKETYLERGRRWIAAAIQAAASPRVSHRTHQALLEHRRVWDCVFVDHDEQVVAPLHVMARFVEISLSDTIDTLALELTREDAR